VSLSGYTFAPLRDKIHMGYSAIEGSIILVGILGRTYMKVVGGRTPVEMEKG
jgi:hypothetical protein